MEWTEEVLERLVLDKASETTELEFKACGALTKNQKAKEELAKDVAAMANAAGGTIIYGMVEKDHIASKVDDGFDENDISKEFLDQVINYGVQPRLEGLRIRRVPLPSKGNKVANVVEIPQAVERAPHQTVHDRRYYKRSNTTTQWMEDYEIRDALRRARVSDLHITWHLREPTLRWTS